MPVTVCLLVNCLTYKSVFDPYIKGENKLAITCKIFRYSSGKNHFNFVEQKNFNKIVLQLKTTL